MKNIHWIGTGLSSISGIKRIISKKQNLTLWNRTLDNALRYTPNSRKFDLNDLYNNINKDDIVVSQLPANMHIDIAKICLKKKANFITSSYLSDEMKLLENDINKNNLIFINEVGLDPGIDHFYTHLLADDLIKQNFENDINITYKSYCGGLPEKSNDFKYKFSWSPIGVLKALNNESTHINDYSIIKTDKPYKNITNQEINNEIFELYPNRNSLPYIKDYNLDKYKIKNFVRGTLRLNNWSDAWKDIFKIFDSNIDIEEKIIKKSDELWKKYKYQDNEKDRVVMYILLQAEKNNKIIWSKSYHLDEIGSNNETAMSRLVSVPISCVIDLILNNKLNKPGLYKSISNIDHIKYIIKELDIL